MRQNKKIFLILCLLCTLALGQILTRPDKIEAKKKEVKKITLNRSRLLIAKGKKCTLKVKKISPNGISKKEVYFTSSRPKIAKITKAGKLTAKKTGTAKITARVKGSKAKAVCTVKVASQVKQVSLKKNSLTLNKGDKVKLSDLATSSHTITYKSDDSKIAKVSKSGVLQAVLHAWHWRRPQGMESWFSPEYTG